MPLFEISNLSKRFGRNKVLINMDFSVEQGEFVTIIGESGSGKSLLLKLLIGLLEADTGVIRFEGEEIVCGDEQAWLHLRKNVGMLFQETALFDSLNVFENVAYGLRERGELSESEIIERVAESLTLVSLPGIEAMWPAELSGGMRRRVALARAIAIRPRVLFYDEPTEGLDPINVTRVNRLLLGVGEQLNATTVVVTHNLKSAFATSDRIAMIHEGKIHYSASPEETRACSDPVVRKFIGSRAA